MKSIVVYQSKTGFTKIYANWIAEAFSCDVVELRHSKSYDFQQYDTIFYGGSLYASGVLGYKKFLRSMTPNGRQKVIVFAVGATPLTATLENELTLANISKNHQTFTQLFYLRGGFHFEKLNFFDRLLMTLMKKRIQSKPEDKRTPDERGMLAAYDTPLNFTSKKNLQPLITYVKKGCVHG